MHIDHTKYEYFINPLPPHDFQFPHFGPTVPNYIFLNGPGDFNVGLPRNPLRMGLGN